MKFSKFVGILLLCAALTGCAQTKPAETTLPTTIGETQPAPTLPDENSQLSLIWHARDTWRVEEETDGWCYAVTDLDGNGRLEILSSETHGTGSFTTLRAWEVSEDGSSLTKITEPDESGVGPVLSAGYYFGENPALEAVVSYPDSNGVTYYLYTDTNKDGYAHYYETKSEVFLTNGQLKSRILATMQTDYEPDGKATVTCRDAAGQPISQDDYDTAAERHFEGISRKNTTFGWLTCLHFEELSEDLLRASWESFQR